jgi:two-component system cell cycle response regulator DivK
MAEADRGTGCDVLLVDDEADNREVYAQYLTYSGCRVETAADGEEALAKVADLQPRVIIMDMALPRLDGWEATRRLKADPATRHIPVLALSAHVLPELKRKALEAGVDAYLIKPLAPGDLLEAIRRHMDGPSTPVE